MKKLFSGLTAIAIAILLMPAAPAAAEEIDWASDYQAALTEARERDTLVMIKVYTDWCHWCKELDKNVFTDARVIELSKSIVNLKANAEDEGYGTQVAQLFGVQGYPTTLFVNGDGEEIDRIGGYLPAEDFLAEMNRIKAMKGSMAEMYQSGDMSADEHVAYALRYLEQDDIDSGEEILLKSLERHPHSEGNARAVAYLMMIRALKNDDAGADEYLAMLKGKFSTDSELIDRAEQTLEQIRSER